MLAEAQALLGLGYSVIPLKPRQKTPLLKSWAPFQERVATKAEVTAWWEKWPDANVGIVCGAVSNVFVLDIDGPDGKASVSERTLPETAVAVTGNGEHYYFKHPGFKVGNRAGLLPGIDIRGDGGYVVAPPSVHPNGMDYSWDWQRSPDDVNIADAPQWLLDLLQDVAPVQAPAPAQHQHAATDEDASPFQDDDDAVGGGGWFMEGLQNGIPEGKRNSELTRLAGRYFAMRSPKEEVLEILRLVNAQRCRPPLPDAGVVTIVESINKREVAKQVSAGSPQTPAEDTNDAARKQGILEGLSQAFGVKVLCVKRYMTNPPTFVMDTDHGRVDLGTAANLLSFTNFCNHFAGVTRVIPRVGKKDWPAKAQWILHACDDVTVARDATALGGMEDTICQYLQARRPAPPRDWEAAAETYMPFELNGGVYITLGDLAWWLRTVKYDSTEKPALAVLLQEYGAVADTLKTRRGITRSYYRIDKKRIMRTLARTDDPFDDEEGQ